MKAKRSFLYLVIAVYVTVTLAAGFAQVVWHPWLLVNEPLHAAMEASGALAAIVMAVFLLMKRADGSDDMQFLLALGFIGMGILDAFHSASPPGDSFVLLHSAASLTGGFWFALIWVPWPGGYWPLRKWLPLAVAAVSAALGAAMLVFNAAVPPMISGGSFTSLSKYINVLAGVLFITASARLLLDFHRTLDFERYVLSCLTLLFGLSELMFSYSMIWNSVWWFWHLERLGAYVMVLGWVISGHMRLVSDLRAALAERKRQEEEKSALYHMMTHDVRGPLSVIYGYTEILEQQFAGEGTGGMFGEIKKAVRRISRLIDDMLTLAKVESGSQRLTLETVTLQEVLDLSMRESEMTAADMSVRMDLNIDEGLPNILADRSMLGRAFGNLVSNAVKYNQSGGEVRVRASACPGSPDRVSVEISDTGPGIAPEDLPHVFDKYYRGSKTGQRLGTGLGLAVVKAAVEAHGGTVTVTSGKSGSTFRVVLPIGAGGDPKGHG